MRGLGHLDARASPAPVTRVRPAPLREMLPPDREKLPQIFLRISLNITDYTTFSKRARKLCFCIPHLFLPPFANYYLLRVPDCKKTENHWRRVCGIGHVEYARVKTPAFVKKLGRCSDVCVPNEPEHVTFNLLQPDPDVG